MPGRNLLSLGTHQRLGGTWPWFGGQNTRHATSPPRSSVWHHTTHVLGLPGEMTMDLSRFVPEGRKPAKERPLLAQGAWPPRPHPPRASTDVSARFTDGGPAPCPIINRLSSPAVLCKAHPIFKADYEAAGFVFIGWIADIGWPPFATLGTNIHT